MLFIALIIALLVLALGARFAPIDVIVSVGVGMLVNVISYIIDDRIEREFGKYCTTYPVYLDLVMGTTNLNLTVIEATLFLFIEYVAFYIALFVITMPLFILCLLATAYLDIRSIEGRLVYSRSASVRVAWGVSLMLYKELIHNRRASREYNNIPSVDFHQDVGRGDLTCSMCLEDFIEGETVKRMDICEHIFHPECIYTWVHVHCSCPMCRRMV